MTMAKNPPPRALSVHDLRKTQSTYRCANKVSSVRRTHFGTLLRNTRELGGYRVKVSLGQDIYEARKVNYFRFPTKQSRPNNYFVNWNLCSRMRRKFRRYYSDWRNNYNEVMRELEAGIYAKHRDDVLTSRYIGELFSVVRNSPIKCLQFLSKLKRRRRRRKRLSGGARRTRARHKLLQAQSGVDVKEANRRAFVKSQASKMFDKKRSKLPRRAKKQIGLLRDEMCKNFNHDGSIKKRSPQFTPESGCFPESGVAGALSAILGLNDNSVVNHAENLIALLCGLSTAHDYPTMTSIMFLYFKTISNKSVCESLRKYVFGLFSESDPDSVPELDILPESGLDLTESLRALGKNFSVFVHNEAFKKISYLLSACVCVGLCEASSLTWTVCGVKLFTPNTYQRHVTATDLIDAVLSTVTYFVEGGYEFFRTGSLGGFLYSDSKIDRLSSSYSELRSYSAYFRTGLLTEKTGMSEHDYSARLDETLDGIKKLISLSSGVERSVLQRMMDGLYNLKVEFAASRVQGGIREAPYTIALVGPSGSGKSTLACVLPSIIAIMNGFDGSPKRVATVKADDKFQPNIRGDTTVVILDDLFNTHPDFLQVAPTENVIMFSNNSIQYANMPDVESKGKVPINPKLLIISSNLHDMGASMGSNEPSAVERRALCHVTVRARPELCKGVNGQGLDSVKVRAKYNGDVPDIPDIWLMDVCEPITVRSSVIRAKDVTEYRPYVDEEGPMIGVDVYRWLRWLKSHTADYYANQKALVRRSNTIHDRISMCSGCGYVNVACNCPIDTHSAIALGAWGIAVKSVVDMFVGDVVERAQVATLEGLKECFVSLTDKNLNGYIAKGIRFAFDLALPKRRPELLMRDIGVVKRVKRMVLFDIVMFFVTAYFCGGSGMHFLGWCGVPLCQLLFFTSAAHPHNDQLRYVLEMVVLAITVTQLALCSFTSVMGFWSFITAAACVYYCTTDLIEHYTVVMKVRYATIDRIISMRTETVSNIVTRIREVRKESILAASMTLAAIYMAIRSYKRAKYMLDLVPHGKLQPEERIDIEARGMEVSNWLKPTLTPIIHERRLMTMTSEQAVKKVFSNQCFLKIAQGNTYRFCDCIFIQTSVIVMPYHMLFRDGKAMGEPPDGQHFTFFRAGQQCISAVFKCTVSSVSWVRVPDTDFAIVHVPSCCDLEDLSYMITDSAYSGLAQFVYKNEDGEMIQDSTTVKHKPDAGHAYSRFDGLEYNLSWPTYKGLCMGTLVSDDKGKRIVGFHLGGRGTNYGIGGILYKSAYLDALGKLSEKVIVPHSSGEFTNTSFGMDIITAEHIDKRSPVNFLLESGSFGVYGCCNGGVTTSSSVTKSYISDLVKEVMGLENKWGPPQFKPKWKPWYTNLTTIVTPSSGFDPNVLQWAIDDYLRPILHKIEEKDFAREMIRPLSDLETINGMVGVRFVDRMNMQTSIGFPLSGPKTNYLVQLPPQGEWENPVTFNDVVWDEIKRVEQSLLNGERAYVIYKGCLKDEPTKIDSEKVRVINSAPIAMQFLTRKYLLGVCRFINNFPLLCESMVGINCMSEEWEEMCSFLTQNGLLNSRTFAVDYTKYDHKLPAQLTLATYLVFEKLCIASGNYSSDDIRIIRGIATEAAYPFVAYNGTVLSYAGGTISGTTMTVYQNNVGNSLLQRCAFLELELVPRSLWRSFREGVRIGNYGDDVKGCIEKWVEHYNMKSYADYMAKHSITVTMPNKLPEMVEFMEWKDADFLKRLDNFIPEIGFTLGRLQEDSILKSLHSNLRSKSLSREELAVACLEGAMHEWFAFGREHYTLRREQVLEICKLAKIDVPGALLTFDERVERWDTKAESYAEMRKQLESIMPESGVMDSNMNTSGYRSVETIGFCIYEQICVYTQVYTINPCGDVVWVDHTPIHLRPGTCLYNLFIGRAVTTHDSTEGTDVPNSSTSSLNYSISTVSSMTYISDVEPQSGVAFTVDPVPASTPTMDFSSMSPGYTYSAGDMSDPSRGVADNSDDNITEFFRRPMLLDTFSWTPNAGVYFYETFNPMALYTTQSRVANRLSNYKNMRGRLHLRFLINGQPFVYGRMLVHAFPRSTDQFTRIRALVLEDMIAGSQNPHIYLNPTTSTGGDLVLPFIWRYNALDLTSIQMDETWTVVMREIAPLYSLQSATPNTIRVLAWMEEIVLSSPTDHNITGIVPQSGVADEYGDKPISTPASIIAKEAGKLKSAPIIGRYARATEQAANMVAGVANALGFSRPVDISSRNAFEMHTAGSFANTNVPDASVKLSLDGKKEVSIDPRVAGMSGEDEMDLKSLAMRESYLTQFVWEEDTAPGTNLFFMRVNPMQFSEYAASTPPEIHMTPSSWVCVPFEYWRGSMKVRFQVVSSNFHRGRLRISYDPVYSKTSDSFNTVRSHIVDISETKDFVIKIGWSNERTFLKCSQFNDPSYSSSLIVPNFLQDNGTIRVEVFTELQSSDATGSAEGVRILVHPSMCEDFEVASPRSIVMHNMTYLDPNVPPGFADIQPESGVNDPMIGDTPAMEAPINNIIDGDLSTGLINTGDHNTLGCFGESCTNWRGPLKRYCFHHCTKSNFAGTSTATSLMRHTRPDFPVYRGLTPLGVHSSVDGNYNYTHTTLMNWVTPAYVGWKGAIRWKYYAIALTSNFPMLLSVTRLSENLGWSNTEWILSNNTNSSVYAEFFRENLVSTWNGTHWTVASVNPTVSVEVPYYNSNRFHLARIRDVNDTVAAIEQRCHILNTAATFNARIPILASVAAGEDFALYMFLSVPIAWKTTSDPAPTLEP